MALSIDEKLRRYLLVPSNAHDAIEELLALCPQIKSGSGIQIALSGLEKFKFKSDIKEIAFDKVIMW